MNNVVYSIMGVNKISWFDQYFGKVCLLHYSSEFICASIVIVCLRDYVAPYFWSKRWHQKDILTFIHISVKSDWIIFSNLTTYFIHASCHNTGHLILKFLFFCYFLSAAEFWILEPFQAMLYLYLIWVKEPFISELYFF